MIRLEEEHSFISIYGREISSIADSSQLLRYSGFDGIFSHTADSPESCFFFPSSMPVRFTEKQKLTLYIQ
jgi:hypothetical protein